MKPIRRGVRGVPKTPRITSASSDDDNLKNKKIQDPVEVYCRLRPRSNSSENSCISLISASQLLLTPPDFIKNRKVVSYTFNHIFTEHADQKEIFDHIAIPLLNGLIKGENGLLFSYGVTGSGKTYTMSGEQTNPGIVPRCIHMLFNSINAFQTPKFVIKSDKMNGFEMQTESEALMERLQEAKLKRKTSKQKCVESSSTPQVPLFLNDGITIPEIDENLLYTVFVSYVEIYNNCVYDLLDENSNTRSLQSKILREDCSRNIYVNGVVEIEVKTADEALELYLLGNNKKRMGKTLLNMESSRSHSVFTIRLVISTTENNTSKDRNSLMVSQLSLVDLAGSERCSRTHTKGQRLKEAGSINNSLMALRTCLEVLRENQQTGLTKMVPYRESRLTHLFKNFFEGEGKVKMIVCVNSSPNDYDETVHVMKFAEMTQEVKVLRPEVKLIESRIREKPVNLQLADVNEPRPINHITGSIPKVQLIDPETDEIRNLILYLKRKCDYTKKQKFFRKSSYKIRNRIVDLQDAKDKYEKQVKYLLPAEREKNHNLNVKLHEAIFQQNKLQDQCEEKDKLIEQLQQTIEEKNFKLKQSLIDKAKHKRKIEQVSEKMTHELDAKLRRQREYLTAAMKEKTDKLDLVKDILSDKVSTNVKSIPESYTDLNDENIPPVNVPTTTTVREETVSNGMHVSRRDAPVSNIRYRRSRSIGEVWLEHRPVNPVPLGTVLQPVMKCRKSITKLTNLKDVVNPKQNKYVLISQNQDDVGDLETKLYKGDIIPTCSGGAQVIFDDVEKLKQESPMQQKLIRTSTSNIPPSTSDKCAVSIEGHTKKIKK